MQIGKQVGWTTDTWNEQALYRSIAAVYSRVLLDTIPDVYSGAPADAGFEPVAAIRFAGDYHGFLRVYLRPADIRAAADHMLARYRIALPVEDAVVFSEFINVLSGNLAIELQRYGVTIDKLYPPDLSGAVPPVCTAYWVRVDGRFPMCLGFFISNHGESGI